MAQVTNTFIAGKMNKSLDDRLIPKNQYKDGLNIRVDSSDASEAGRVENEKGNERLAQLVFRTTDQGDISLSSAKTIGAYADGQNETIYYFVHDPTVSIGGATYKYDAIISYNVEQNSLRYIIEQVHPVLSVGSTVLNFDPEHLITGVDLIDNLLFFTDDLNPPRYINIDRAYSGIQRANPYSSLVTEDDISVIVKPPIESPTISLSGQTKTENYMQDKFICFAYRWRYVDGQYSALSQFTKPAFLPGSFFFDATLQENKNMKNGFAEAIISFNTGSEVVTDIEVVFKEITSNNVYSIERFNKEELGYSNNATETTTFSNQKIFTLLDPNQLGRLYDNVPLKAKAQTTMGNRIIYGNYIEGYDLTDTNDDKIKTNFTTELRNPFAEEPPISSGFITASSSGVSQYIYTTLNELSGANNYYQAYPFAIGLYNLGFELDFSGVTFPLAAGTELTVNLTLQVNETRIDNANTDGTSTLQPTVYDLNHTYTLETAATSTADLFSQQSFIDSFGGNADVIPEYSFRGVTTTNENFAIKILNTLFTEANAKSGYAIRNYNGSGVDSYQGTQGSLTSFVVNDLPTGKYVLTDSGKNFTTAGVNVSDRVIMSSTVAGSGNVNTPNPVFTVLEVSFGGDTTKLLVQANQPEIFTSIYPVANDNYAIYDFENYQTVLITNPSTNIIRIQLPHSKYFQVTGGTTFEAYFYRPALSTIAASLSTGPSETLKSDRDYELGIIYMDDYNRSSNVIVSGADATTFVPLQSAKNQNFIRAAIPTTMTAPSWATRYKFAIKQNKDAYKEIFTDYACQSQSTSPSGSGFVYFKLSGDNVSKVNEGDTIYIKGDRRNGGSTFESSTEDVTRVVLSKEVLGEGDIGNYSSIRGGNTSGSIPNPSGVYITVKQETVPPFDIPDVNTNIDFPITLETVAEELDSFVYYEGVESYPIVNGYHEDGNGNSNQLSTLEIDTTFFNAYTFFNGVESSSILDRITSKSLALGNRVYSTSEEEYKQIRRTTDLTYSGVYQGEVGINKLNEFNLSLANFKELEESFGPIQKLFARETDVLVLQEDKISYVLAGKNLLSDSVGGGNVTSIPEVLGTQIARTEEYGISFNPESFASYGYDRYFTDVKRGAVLQLRGSSARNDQLTVISEFGMRSYFRDTLEPKLYKQVIGAYDEYSNEYVLSATDDNIPQEAFVIRCGSEVIVEGNTTFVVELGEDEGDVTVIAERISGEGTVDLDATWNSVTTNIGTGESGDFNGFFTKSPVGPPTTAEFTYTGTAKYRILVNCPIG